MTIHSDIYELCARCHIRPCLCPPRRGADLADRIRDKQEAPHGGHVVPRISRDFRNRRGGGGGGE